MAMFKCDVCGRTQLAPLTLSEARRHGPYVCRFCDSGTMSVVDDRPVSKESDALNAPAGDGPVEQADSLGVDLRRNVFVGTLEGDEPDARLVVLEGNIAYINVLAVMMTLEVEDTPRTRSLVTAPLAAVLKERGYSPVLVGLDD